MNIPTNIKYIIERILESESRWKALYMATWGYSYEIKKYKKTKFWKIPIKLGLPASKNGQYTYRPEELHLILTSRDGEFTIGHLQTLFSLLEELLNETSKILFGFELNTGRWKDMKRFFNQTYIKDVFSKQNVNELKELKLAKETRNCFIHNGLKVGQKWLNAYRDARKVSSSITLGGDLQKGLGNKFHQIEDWHELIIDITKRIEMKIILK
jgi:hypothetical protein